MLDIKYKELGGSGLVTTPLNMAPNLSECNVSHPGIAHPVMRRHVSFNVVSTSLRCVERAQTGQQYSATERHQRSLGGTLLAGSLPDLDADGSRYSTCPARLVRWRV